MSERAQSILHPHLVTLACSPSGLTFTSDEILYELLADMQRWKEGLPDNLRFRGPDTPRNAGKGSPTGLAKPRLSSRTGVLFVFSRHSPPSLRMRVHDVLARFHAN